LHAPPVQHADTLVLPSVPDIRDDDSIHSDATYSDSDSEDYEHGVEQVVHPDEEPTPELQVDAQVGTVHTSGSRKPCRESIGFEEDSISA
jgi:hypothetical protein